MRCLLVEDEPDRVAAILPELRRICGETSVDVAGDRDTAVASVERMAFDLVVLDQRIPSGPGQLDAAVIHGRAVLDHILNEAPATPVYFLTGLPMEDDYIDRLMADGSKCDVWGDRRPVSLILKFQKSTLTPFYEAVGAIAATARATDGIEINDKGALLELSVPEARLLRCFARLHDGVCVDIESLNGGQSGARVMKIDVKDGRGGIRISAASKLGAHKAILDEMGRYEREVVRLAPGSYAPLIPGNVARVGRSMGAFYRLLEGYDYSLFSVLRSSEVNAAGCVRGLQVSQVPWTNNRETRRARIGDLVKLLIWEARLPAIHDLLEGIDWEGFENREIDGNYCTRHGDLHGENVRVDGGHRVMTIDYGAVGVLPSAIDAVTLELSPFFHPRGMRGLLNWRPGDGALDWYDRDAFAARTVIPVYIRAARDWAHRDAFGGREVLACGYAYVLRQMQFPNADVETARAIIAGIVARGPAM